MKANNFDFKASSLSSEFISYESGKYRYEAYDILEIEGELQEGEWCDIVVNRHEMYAVASDVEATAKGEFYFKKIRGIGEGDGEVLIKLGKVIANFKINNDEEIEKITYFQLEGFTWRYNHNGNGQAYISCKDRIMYDLARSVF